MDQRNEEFDQWRTRAVESLPQLARQVFDLDPRDYNIEQDFGFIVHKLHDREDQGFYDGLTSMAKQSALRITVESIHERLAGHNDSAADENAAG